MSHDIVLRDNGANVHDIALSTPLPNPADVGIVDVREPINLAPGYVIQTDRDLVSINGSPFFPVENAVALDDEGCYVILVADLDASRGLEQVVCIVDATAIVAGAKPPSTAPPAAFARLAALLPAVYPHGRIAPRAVNRPYQVDVATNRAAAFEIRAKEANGMFAKVGVALARAPGIWRSEAFALPRGLSDMRLAVVFADSGTEIS